MVSSGVFEQRRGAASDLPASLAARGDESEGVISRKSCDRCRIQRTRAFERGGGARRGTGTPCPRTRAAHGERRHGGHVKAYRRHVTVESPL